MDGIIVLASLEPARHKEPSSDQTQMLDRYFSPMAIVFCNNIGVAVSQINELYKGYEGLNGLDSAHNLRNVTFHDKTLLL